MKLNTCFKACLVWIALALIGGELFARFGLRLGTPPLTMTHPTIEYMYKPNQDVSRFGNRFLVNDYGMRSPHFPEQKTDTNELRVLVFGDSVVNGGNLTDHEKLATTILAHELERDLHRKVIVGNVSAGSWGPGNWLAYVRQFGFFDADVVVLVISSHDIGDNPDFAPLNPDTHPTEAPRFAMIEGATRYLPRYLPWLVNEDSQGKMPVLSEDSVMRGSQDLREFLEMAKDAASSVVVMHHSERSEMSMARYGDGFRHIESICNEKGVPLVLLAPYFDSAIKTGKNPYRDNIHPNHIGQELMARALIKAVETRSDCFTAGRVALADQSGMKSGGCFGQN